MYYSLCIYIDILYLPWYFEDGWYDKKTLSVGIFFQYLFKNDSRSFSEMQTQLYGFSTLCSFLIYGLQTAATKDSNQFCEKVDGWQCKFEVDKLKSAFIDDYLYCDIIS